MVATFYFWLFYFHQSKHIGMAEALIWFSTVKLEFTVPRKESCHSISEVVIAELQFKAALYIGLNGKGLGLKFLGLPIAWASPHQSQLSLGCYCIKQNAWIMNVLWYLCCYLVMSKWLPLPHLITYMAIDVCFCLRAWKAMLCVGTKAGLLLLCFVVLLYHCGKWGCSPLPPLKCLLFWDCAKGLRWAPAFLLALFVPTLWQGESVPLIVLWHFHLFWEALVHFKDILAWFSFAQLQIAVGICSASLMTSSLRAFEIWMSAKALPFAVPSSAETFLEHLPAVLELCCWGCLACWDGVVDCCLCYHGTHSILGAAECHTEVTFSVFVKPCKS